MRQFTKSRRRLSAGAFILIAAPVALGSVAYACQSLATLHANPGTAAAGGSVTLFGKNYSISPTSSKVMIRLNTRDGRVLGEFSPSAVGTRGVLNNVTLDIPSDVAVGVHTLLATQTLESGAAASGTPGRATLTVTAARTSTQGSGASAAAATSSDPVAATPVAATPAAAVAAEAPATASVAAGTPAARTAASAAPAAAAAAAVTDGAPSAAVAADGAATTSVAATPAAPAAAPAAAEAAQVSVAGLLPASSSSTSILPGLTLGAGLALVLLSLAAFIKSSRTLRSDAPLAG